MNWGKVGVFFAYLVLGAYFINESIGVYTLPEMFSPLDKWLVLAGGLFLVAGAFMFVIITRKKKFSN